jgi:hypothetical protein
MKHRLLFLYQLLTGLSDTATGVLLVAAPAFTLHLMHVNAPPDALPYLSWVGAFVLSVGLACLYGAFLTTRPIFTAKLETVWVLTTIARASVALFVASQIAAGALASGWISVPITDGAIALFQIIGLSRSHTSSRSWLSDDAN